MDELADRLLCPKEPVFRSNVGSGEDNSFHREDCVKGTCRKCKGVTIFDSCPRHRQGEVETNGGQPPVCSWKTFGPVHDENNQHSGDVRRGEDEQNYFPPGTKPRRQPRLVRIGRASGGIH